MENNASISGPLSPWWRQAVILVMIFGFTILIWLAAKTYQDAPPIPDKVAGPTGEVLFTNQDILSGQEVFLRYGLMENGTIWGHGAYLGPDFSAEYLHTLAVDAGESIARQRYNRSLQTLTTTERQTITAEVAQSLKQNRFDPQSKTLIFTQEEAGSYQKQIEKWKEYFSQPARSLAILDHSPVGRRIL